MVESRPMPAFRRIMIFADGENLVFRYQAMIKDGWVPRDDLVHIPDVLVWSGWCSGLVGLHNVIRGTYYTYATGDDSRIMDIKDQIRQLRFAKHRDSQLPHSLSPKVFKKPKKTAKAKGVDIQMCVDILTQVHNDNVDAILLLSGDGDYIPLIEEVLRNGKQVYLAAFSNGLNPSLPHLADGFYCLDHHAFPFGAPGET